MIKVSNYADRPYRILNPGDSPDLQAFIDRVEEQQLKELLGIEFYDALIAGLAASTPAQKWVDLRDGKNYTLNDKTYRYEGLVKMLVPCIYSFWLRERRDTFTTSGSIYTTADKSEHLSPAWRIADAYNAFNRMAGGPRRQVNTLYGFLINSEEDYGNFIWCQPGIMNELGL